MYKWNRKKLLPVGSVLEYDHHGRDVVITGENGSLRISAPGEHVLRIRTGRNGRFVDDRSYAVADRKGKIQPSISETEEDIQISFEGFRLVVMKRPIRITVYDHEGRLIWNDHPEGGLFWSDSEVQSAHEIEAGAKYFGFGEKTGPLNKLGKSLKMWATDVPYTRNYDPLYVSIPFSVVLNENRAHGLFFDDAGLSHFEVGSKIKDAFIYRAHSGEMDLYLIEGPSVREVLERFTALVGRMALPPRWSLGHHQCRWSYMNDEEVRQIAAEFRERDIPTCAIYLG